MWTLDKHVLVTVALFTLFICVTVQKMADAIQDEQKKMEELADKLGFVQTFVSSISFLLQVPLFYLSATVPSRQCCKLIRVVILREFHVWRYEFSNFWSLPTLVCQLKFAVWRPLKTIKTPLANLKFLQSFFYGSIRNEVFSIFVKKAKGKFCIWASVSVAWRGWE